MRLPIPAFQWLKRRCRLGLLSRRRSYLSGPNDHVNLDLHLNTENQKTGQFQVNNPDMVTLKKSQLK